MVARLLLVGDPSCSCARKSSVSSKRAVGFSSCPASMRSSPHHSGVLAVVNKATPDLHTAIQSAIAHCKQSQLATSTAESNSNHP
ncbi:hypothetical protein KP509_30G060600 [Ceratopteris richardii]|nr:hypothetical protein KP509_30G060600 [Ceratopteris richardii]